MSRMPLLCLYLPYTQLTLFDLIDLDDSFFEYILSLESLLNNQQFLSSTTKTENSV